MIVKFFHILLLLTQFAASIMLQVETFSAVFSIAKLAFDTFDLECSGAILDFAAGVVGVGLEELICFELFQAMGCFFIEELVNG